MLFNLLLGLSLRVLLQNYVLDYWPVVAVYIAFSLVIRFDSVLDINSATKSISCDVQLSSKIKRDVCLLF